MSRRRVSASRRLAAPSSFALVTVAVMTVHTLARDHRWRYEWLWAAYQYQFGVLLLGPVLSGLGAWVGRRAAQGRWLTHPSGRPGVALRPLGLAIAATWAAYMAAAIVPAVVVLRSDTTDHLGLSAVATFAPALVALAAYIAAGFAAGVWIPRAVTPPVVAIGAFGLTMAGWITGTERLVRLGGAGMTMVALRPSPLIQVAQVALYGSLAALATAWSAGRLAGGTDGRLVRRGLGVGSAAVAVWLVLTTAPMFDHPRVDDVCVDGDGASVCAARPYDVPLRSLSAELAPALGRMRAAGAPVPARVRLGATVGLFEPSPSPELLAAELFDVLGVGECWSPAAADDITNLTSWLSVLVGDRDRIRAMASYPDTPLALRSSDPKQQDAWAASAIQRVRAVCPSFR